MALRASGVSVKGGKQWQEICAFYDSLGETRAETPPPPTLHAELKPYQKQGVRWIEDLYRLKLGGILADDMGLGKTVQALAFLENLRVSKELGATLILVPTSLTYNWMAESKRFTPELPVRNFQAKDAASLSAFFENHPHGILICTYGLFTEHQSVLEKVPWNIHLYDEAQNLKTLSTQRTTAARRIPARFKLCLTGTPLENHLGELYSLMDLVVPGSLGDYRAFKEKFVTKIGVPDKDALAYLRLKIKPLVLRRTKSEILKELPPKTESAITLPFESKQKHIYRDIALSWNERVRESIRSQGEAKSQLMMLTALLRLRQVCSDPASLPNISYEETPPKVRLLVDSLEEITDSGESALVFTQFLGTLARIKGELAKAGIPHFSIDGGTSRPERERILAAFHESSHGTVLVMTLKTGGVGLNLTKASYVFHIEPWWNPAVEDQASDRAHRIGQEKPVQVYRYLMEESVEEKITTLKTRKAQQFNALFGIVESESDVANESQLLTQQDFELLLGNT